MKSYKQKKSGERVRERKECGGPLPVYCDKNFICVKCTKLLRTHGSRSPKSGSKM